MQKPAQNAAKTGQDAKPAPNAKPAQSSKTPANSRSNNDKSWQHFIAQSAQQRRRNRPCGAPGSQRQQPRQIRSNNDKSATTIHRATSATIMTTKSAVRHVRQPMPITAPTVAAAMPIRAAAPTRARRNDDEIGQIARQAEVASTTSRTENTARNNDDEIGGLRAKAALPQAPPPAVSCRRGAAMWMI